MAITRRDFLAASLGTSTLAALGGGVPGFLARTAAAAPAGRDARDTILVVVQLAGGNDGLNTVVPYGDDGYGRNRTTLRLPAARLHKIDALLGFHPEMQAFDRLLQGRPLDDRAGRRLSGPQPAASGGHVRLADRTARRTDRTLGQSGWLGRAADRAVRPGDPAVPAVFVGQIKQPFSLNAERAVVPSLDSLDDWILPQPPPVPPGSAVHAAGDGLLDFVRRASDAAQRASRRIESLVRAAVGVRGWRVSAVSTGGHALHGRPTDPCRSGDSHLLHRAWRAESGRLRQPCRSARQPRLAAAAVVRVRGGVPRRSAAAETARPRSADDLLRVRPQRGGERPPRDRSRRRRRRCSWPAARSAAAWSAGIRASPIWTTAVCASTPTSAACMPRSWTAGSAGKAKRSSGGSTSCFRLFEAAPGAIVHRSMSQRKLLPLHVLSGFEPSSGRLPKRTPGHRL